MIQKWLFSEANRDGTDAESPFPVFFSFSASFKNSSPRGKVAKLSSLWDRWAESLFVSIIVAKYNLFPLANNCRSRKKKNSGESICSRYAHAYSAHYRDLEHAYVYWIWLRCSASYVIKMNWLMLLAVRIPIYGCTWEVWRALKKLELLSAIASSKSYASIVLSKLPACIHNLIYAS